MFAYSQNCFFLFFVVVFFYRDSHLIALVNAYMSYNVKNNDNLS